MGSQEQNSEKEKKYGVGFCFGLASAEKWKQNPTPLGLLTSINCSKLFDYRGHSLSWKNLIGITEYFQMKKSSFFTKIEL